jgi:hypothetical protein
MNSIKRSFLYALCAVALGMSNQSNADDTLASLIGLVVVGGVGYKVYMAYQPTPESIAKLNLEQDRNALERKKIEREMEAIRAEKSFKTCLEENVHATPNAKGSVPDSCKDFALALAFAAGNEKVTDMLAAFNKYKPERVYRRDE